MATLLLSFDVEDWYQMFARTLSGRELARPQAFERQLDRILELLSRFSCRATFFCLGCSLYKQPHLVRRIDRAGHEIASHGWNHELIHRTGLDAFRDDLHRSLSWLQDLLGRPVRGFRAPAFSVAPEQLKSFYDICFERGLSYDSSVFPIAGRRYGNPRASATPHVVREQGTRRLVEVPLATIPAMGRRWPVAGGGYWRLLPAWWISRAVRLVGRAGAPFVSYFHPYEFDADDLDVLEFSNPTSRAWRLALMQNLGRRSAYRKLEMMLGAHRIVAIEDYLEDAGLLGRKGRDTVSAVRPTPVGTTAGSIV